MLQILAHSHIQYPFVPPIRTYNFINLYKLTFLNKGLGKICQVEELC